VTGASSGIGAAVAERLVAEGVRVALVARRVDRLRALAQRVDPAGERTLVVSGDVRHEASIASVFRAVRGHWGGVDVLVNNAGLGYAASLIDGETAAWREMLEVNVLGLCICTREALSDMLPNNRGHVLHISSMAAHRVPPGSGVYSASKYAVRSLTEGLRQELRGRGSAVRVTAISPAYVETEFAEKYHGGPGKAAETYGRFKVLEAADVANAAWYVLSQPAHVQVHDILLRATEQPS
jgi:NADP-dependent 3-hydroxy acid dehydrogenase YdfG